MLSLIKEDHIIQYKVNKMSRFYPLPTNTLIQIGDSVEIKDLRSKAGQLLNGTTGVACGMDDNGRWIVEYEKEGHADNFCRASIKIQNLEWQGERSKLVGDGFRPDRGTVLTGSAFPCAEGGYY